MTDDLIKQREDGLYALMLGPCDCSILRHLLDPSIPYVWIIAHMPHSTLQWWKAEVPLMQGCKPRTLEVRELRFDILIETAAFLDCLSEFEPFGIELYQIRQRVPNTLVFDRLPERTRMRVLVENGMYSRFFLPHRHECASFAAVERAAVERALAHDAVGELAYS